MESDNLLLGLRRRGIRLNVLGQHGSYTLRVITNKGTRIIPFGSFQELPRVMNKLLSDKPLTLAVNNAQAQLQAAIG